MKEKEKIPWEGAKLTEEKKTDHCSSLWVNLLSYVLDSISQALQEVNKKKKIVTLEIETRKKNPENKCLSQNNVLSKERSSGD